MTDLPQAALLLCGPTDIRLYNASLAADAFGKLSRASGIRVNAKSRIFLPTPKADAETAVRELLFHLCAISDLVVTFGAVGFGESDILPDVTLGICGRRADYFAKYVSGAVPIPLPPPVRRAKPLPPFIPAAERRAMENRRAARLFPFAFALPSVNKRRAVPPPCAADQPKAERLYRVRPSRAAAGICGSTLLLNFPADASDTRVLCGAMLPDVCAALADICGKRAVPTALCDDSVNTISAFAGFDRFASSDS